MTRDPPPSRRDAPTADGDSARTEQAKRVVEEYINELREIFRKLRRFFS